MFSARLLLPLLSLALTAQDTVRTVATYRDPVLGLEVVQGELLLRPAQPWPQLAAARNAGVHQVFLAPPPQAAVTSFTRRSFLERQRTEAEAAVRPVRGNSILREALATYGKAHGGTGPARLDDPEWLSAVGERADHLKATPEVRQQRREERIRTLEKGLRGFVLVPRAVMEPPGPLFLEQAPLLADGRHWVVDTRLQAERKPVDKARLAGLGARLDLSRVQAAPEVPDPARPLPFKVFALKMPGAKTARLDLTPDRGTPTTLAWRLDGGARGGRDLLEQWARARALTWEQGYGEPSPLVAGFKAIQDRLYGKGEAPVPQRERQEGGPSLLSLFGGRAAVQETLQLDRALQGGPGKVHPDPVPLASIPGVPVASHPWKAMLPAAPVAVPPLALCVPADRALLLLPDPKGALDGFRGGGAAFLARVSAFARQGTLDRDLIATAEEDLGLGSGLGRRLLEAGGVRSLAVFLPDLDLLGGTDLTVIAELTPAATPLVGLLIGEEPSAVATPRGQAWRARLGQRLFLSTARAELDRALALHRSGGQGSLGASDEFQVMLAKLAPTAATQAYAYFSDPFIRRLVGPAQRILQMRQAAARRDMEALAAGVELRRLDAPGAPLDLASLRKLGYLPEGLDDQAFTLQDGRVASRDWGSLARMRPLPLTPPGAVEAWEAAAYTTFRDQYTRYWSRYFDPIALRLDTRGAGYGLETFILPLLDQSAYRELKGFLKPGAEPVLAAAPRWSRPHVATLAFPVDWAALLGLGERSMGQLAFPVPDELLGALGKEAHLAFLDAAPVIQVGGGSPSGLMASPDRLGQGGLMFLAPLLLGPLTRPVVLAVPVRDRAGALEGLRKMATGAAYAMAQARSREFEWRIHQESDQRLIVSASLLGMVTLRLSVEVQDDWLVVCNDTSQAGPLVTGSEPRRASHASLTLRPGDLKLGLPAAWQAAVEAQADRAWADQRWLAPWLSAGLGVEDARARSQDLFGGAPLLKASDLGPGPAPANRLYGSPLRPLLPPLPAGVAFGLFEGIRAVEVAVTFEADGLRARVDWD